MEITEKGLASAATSTGTRKTLGGGFAAGAPLPLHADPVVPYPSSVHLSVRLAQAAAGGGSSASAVLDHFLTPWRSAVHRPRKHNYTIFSNIHGKDHAPALRSELMAQCERRRGCLRLARPASDPSGHPLGKEEAFERHARHILEVRVVSAWSPPVAPGPGLKLAPARLA
eukprot:scaffold4470_cov255-Prasinococcus_capsulatus_cf.AAC.29